MFLKRKQSQICLSEDTTLLGLLTGTGPNSGSYQELKSGKTLKRRSQADGPQTLSGLQIRRTMLTVWLLDCYFYT